MASDAEDGISLRIAVLVKQVPRFEEMALQADKRLRRNDVELEMNPYCRRAVAKGVELARNAGGECIVFSLGPPSAEDCLREAIAWGADAGILITDPVLAGSDTLATAKALAAAIKELGPFDLVLAGRSSVDADTGQVGPELAQILGLPFVAGVRTLRLQGTTAAVHCEQDDGWLRAEVALPAVMTCAERLCDPAKVAPPQRAQVAPDRIRRLSGSDLGPGPWGLSGSPTQVGDIQTIVVNRRRGIATGTLDEKVHTAVSLLHQTGAMVEVAPETTGNVADAGAPGTAVIAVLVEPGRASVARELLGAAARLAGSVPASVWAIDAARIDGGQLSRWGADGIVRLTDVSVEEDIATLVSEWCRPRPPSVMLAPSTSWGREVASRIAAAADAGLIGDAVDVDILEERLVGWKPAFGGQLVAAITATSPMQMATIRPGTLPVLAERPSRAVPVIERKGRPAGRVPPDRTPARAVGRPVGSKPKGHRQAMVAPRQADRHYRSKYQPDAVCGHRTLGQVQSHDRGAFGRTRSGHQLRPFGPGVRPVRHRHCG
jgi:electron transfer flavoprotein alpha subunit